MQGRSRNADVENWPVGAQDGEGEGGKHWEIRFNVNTLPCVKRIASGKLLQSVEPSVRSSVMR